MFLDAQKFDSKTGKMVTNKVCYSGSYHEGKRHGKNGLQLFGNLGKYIGDFENDAANGYGKLNFIKGEMRNYYEGEFKDNQLHGHGKLTYDNNTQSITGQFLKGNHILTPTSYTI